MKQRFILLASIVLLGLSPTFTHAAKNDKAVIDSGSIQQQFKYIISKSTRYNEYRAVKNEWLYKLQNHVIDTISDLRTELKNSNQLISNQSESIDSLTNTLSETQANLTQSTKEKNSISIVGILLNKNLYNTIVWLLIAGLGLTLGALFVAYKRSHMITVRTKHELLETKEEFDSHRKKAREREEKMARRHLDEILKYKYQGKKPEPSNNAK